MDAATGFETIPEHVLEKDRTLTSAVNICAGSVGNSIDKPEYLIVAPYTEIEHQLDLNSVDRQSALLARALTYLESTDSKYATTPYTLALNWLETFEQLRVLCADNQHYWTRQTFYVVEFRSQLQALSKPNQEKLFKLDKESHREATSSGGLLKYWFGSTSDDDKLRNLATCKHPHTRLWRAGG